MFHKILAAIDRSPNSKAVFDTAIALTKATGASLLLLHVLSGEEKDSPPIPPLTPIGYNSLNAKLQEDYWQQWHIYEEQGLNLLRSYTDEAAAGGVSNEFTQNSGSPGREICAVAQTWNADTIVMGRRGHSGLNELILGSVSNYVFHHAPCSVHVVHMNVVPNAKTPIASQAQVVH